MAGFAQGLGIMNHTQHGGLVLGNLLEGESPFMHIGTSEGNADQGDQSCIAGCPTISKHLDIPRLQSSMILPF